MTTHPVELDPADFACPRCRATPGQPCRRGLRRRFPVGVVHVTRHHRMVRANGGGRDRVDRFAEQVASSYASPRPAAVREPARRPIPVRRPISENGQ